MSYILIRRPFILFYLFSLFTSKSFLWLGVFNNEYKCFVIIFGILFGILSFHRFQYKLATYYTSDDTIAVYCNRYTGSKKWWICWKGYVKLSYQQEVAKFDKQYHSSGNFLELSVFTIRFFTFSSVWISAWYFYQLTGWGEIRFLSPLES